MPGEQGGTAAQPAANSSYGMFCGPEVMDTFVSQRRCAYLAYLAKYEVTDGCGCVAPRRELVAVGSVPLTKAVGRSDVGSIE